jgi:hypothetical protein
MKKKQNMIKAIKRKKLTTKLLILGFSNSIESMILNGHVQVFRDNVEYY